MFGSRQAALQNQIYVRQIMEMVGPICVFLGGCLTCVWLYLTDTDRL